MDRDSPQATLNVAAVHVGSRALGPGWRSIVWVQGCPFQCAGCVSPDWIPQRPATPMAVAELVATLLADPLVDGLTFSGGEPMLQAAGLAEVAAQARELRDVSLICYTGHRIEHLRGRGASPGVDALLAQVDVLIDGLYRADHNDGVGLRGSSNQRVHHLTQRLADPVHDFESRPRRVEVYRSGEDVLFVGVPPVGLDELLMGAVR
ncbi:4Fe-4S single cluster domain-containing protein [Dactylosporangium sp. NPDC049525]|uniref:4Fe-4S single cluster domain-containing protein n=1 Tax=Dactylosporangium sp. NPDC049525 TaxID=3154730 RepID=UPI0034197951